MTTRCSRVGGGASLRAASAFPCRTTACLASTGPGRALRCAFSEHPTRQVFYP